MLCTASQILGFFGGEMGANKLPNPVCIVILRNKEGAGGGGEKIDAIGHSVNLVYLFPLAFCAFSS